MTQFFQRHTLEKKRGKDAAWGAGLHSLQFKASLLIVAVILVVTSIGMIFSIQAVNQVMQEKEFDRTQQWANTLACGLHPYLVDQRPQEMEQALKRLASAGDVSCLVIADETGKLIGAMDTTDVLLNKFLTADRKALNAETVFEPNVTQYGQNLFLDVTVPVYADYTPKRIGAAHIVGYLRMATDASDTHYKIHQLTEQLGRIAIGAILIVLPVSLLATRRFVQPLNDLAQTAQSIANGAMDARARINSKDEIGALAESFNTMAERVAASQMDLLTLNAELEERVHQRTCDLKELATKDPLTGLYNRRHFSEVMSHEFAAAERYDQDMTVLMLDLDYFKQINDQYGHATGDEVLHALADAIKGSLRESDVGARFGGDEFILLLPQTSSQSASALANRVINLYKSKMGQGFPHLPASVSIGAASLRQTRATSWENLIHEADVAMYNTKQANRKSRDQVAAAQPAPSADSPTPVSSENPDTPAS